jgi:hypothetical protein
MCGARPDGRGVGVTETPLNDLPATSVMDAELRKCGHCSWTTLRKHSILLARKLRVMGLMPTDADVVRADRLLGMLQCARLFHRLGHVDLADSMRDDDIPGFLVTFDLSASDRSEMLDAAFAFISPSSLPLCRTCEDLVLSACGFDALLSLCSGSCPCVAAPVGVLDLTKPDACVPACEGASVTNTCVLAGGVHAEEAPASARSSACYAVPETSAVQQPVMKVHSESTAFCACVDVPVAEQNFQMDIPPELPMHPELQCADGVPFEEAGDGSSPATEAAVDVWESCAMTPSWLLAMIERSWYPDSTAAVVSICFVGAESTTANAQCGNQAFGELPHGGLRARRRT